MQKTSKDTKRSKNFKDEEVNLLLEIAGSYKNILECKKTDAVSVKDKERVWKEVEEECNKSSSVYHRDAKTLKLKYENLKKTAKKRFADEKKYVMGTGSGSDIKSDITETDIKVKNLLGDLTVFGKTSHFDSDATECNQPTSPDHCYVLGCEVLENIPLIFEEEVNLLPNERPDINLPEPAASTVDDEGLLKSKDEFRAMESTQNTGSDDQFSRKQSPLGFKSSFSVKDLRRKTSSPLKVKKNKSSIDSSLAGKKIEYVAKAKEDLIALQRKLAEKQIYFQEIEHVQKMKFLEAEHIAKMKLFQLKMEKKKLEIELLNKRM